uniref:Valine--tRNA ligase n=1 Tax=Strongyloides stercoralis TaxID=6248 RepID=A0A0K0EK48_STRER
MFTAQGMFQNIVSLYFFYHILCWRHAMKMKNHLFNFTTFTFFWVTRMLYGMNIFFITSDFDYNSVKNNSKII